MTRVTLDLVNNEALWDEAIALAQKVVEEFALKPDYRMWKKLIDVCWQIKAGIIGSEAGIRRLAKIIP